MRRVPFIVPRHGDVFSQVLAGKPRELMSRQNDSTKAWGVFPHAEQRRKTGRGYVVREMQSGYPTDQYNYGGIVPVAVFSSRAEKAAERLAGQLTDERANPRRRITERARRFIGKKIRRLAREGYQGRQRVAVAYSEARRRGYKVPKRARKNPVSERSMWTTVKTDVARIHKNLDLGNRGAVALVLQDLERTATIALEQLKRGEHKNQPRRNPLLGIFGPNPRAKIVKELGRVVQVRYKRKDDGGFYYHDFRSRPCVYALSDGSLWIKP